MIFSYEEKYEIKFYYENGVSPVTIWLKGLDARSRFYIEARLGRVRNGNLGDVKNIGEQIYELRFFYGPGYRLYFIFDGKMIILLLHGGNKDTQRKDIKVARERLIKYQRGVNYGKKNHDD